MPTNGYEHSKRYGHFHRKLRSEVAPLVAAGGVECWRCGREIEPGQAWDLGHHDGTLTYAGPEHTACNRATRRLDRLTSSGGRASCPGPCPWGTTRTRTDGTPCACPEPLCANPVNRWWLR